MTAKNAEEIVVIGDTDLLTDFVVGHFGCGEKRDCVLDTQTTDIFIDAAAIGFFLQFIKSGPSHSKSLANLRAG